MLEDSFHFLNPDRYRRYFMFYALATLIGAVILYSKFIFSDGMFESEDMIYAGVFFRSFLVNYVREFGAVPLWNPYIFCGLPFVDAFHGDIFYPLSFLKYFGNLYRMLGFTLVLHVYLAGLFAYLTARQLRLSKLAATMVGVSYMFSGWLNSLIAPGHDGKMFVTALFPLTILFLDRAFDKNRFLNFTLLGLVIGLIILTPHIQLAYYSLWALCGYTIFKLICRYVDTGSARSIIGPGIMAIYAVVLGLALSAVQMLPGYAYAVADSPRVDYSSEYRFSTAFSMHPEEALSMVVPEFCGRDDAWNRNKKYWGRNSFKDNSEYAGLTPLILGIIGLIYGTGRRKYFFGSIGVLVFIFALGDHTPFFRFCYAFVPLIKSTRAPSMAMFLFSFTISILAGMGVDSLRRRAVGDFFRRRTILNMLIYVIPAVLLAGAISFTLAPEWTHHLYARMIYPRLLEDHGRLALAAQNYPRMISGFWFAFGFSLMVSAVIKLAERRRSYLWLLILPALAMADGIRFDRQFIRLIDPMREFSRKPVHDFVLAHAGHYRTFGCGLHQFALQSYINGIPSIIGNHGNQLRSYFRLLADKPGLETNYITPQFINLTGAKYIIMPPELDYSSLPFDDGDLVTVWNDDDYKVVENKGVFPRAYLAGEYRIFEDPDTLAYRVYTSDDDLRRMVYLSEEPDVIIDAVVDPADTAEIVYYGIDSVEIHTLCASPKILTLSDNYYKDWQVLIDGKKRQPLVTYGTFRGVVVDAGEHAVVWKYIPSTYAVGRMITGVTIVYVLAVLFGSALFRRRFRSWGV